MPSPPDLNFDALALAEQIIKLDAEVYREVFAGRYEFAAELRDRREALGRRLSQAGNEILMRNVQRQSWPGRKRGPVLSLLEQQEESVVDPGLLKIIRGAPLPPRWVLNGRPGPCRATLAERLSVNALDSAYFGALLPVLGSATLSRATKPMEWIAAAIREAADETCPVVWVVTEPAYLAERGILDVLMEVLRVPSTHFVVCVQEADAPFSAPFAEIPRVTVVTA